MPLKRERKNTFVKSLYRDLLREAVESKSERGEQLNALMKEGKLVPMVYHSLTVFN
jgi:adenylate kinase family enzyme